jgi:hypothetical protein
MSWPHRVCNSLSPRRAGPSSATPFSSEPGSSFCILLYFDCANFCAKYELMQITGSLSPGFPVSAGNAAQSCIINITVQSTYSQHKIIFQLPTALYIIRYLTSLVLLVVSNYQPRAWGTVIFTTYKHCKRFPLAIYCLKLFLSCYVALISSPQNTGSYWIYNTLKKANVCAIWF